MVDPDLEIFTAEQKARLSEAREADRRAHFEAERVKAEIAKVETEREKLKAEIREISRPVFMRSGFWAAFVPGLAAVATAYYAINSNFFDVEEKRRQADITMTNARLLEAESRETARAAKFDAERILAEARRAELRAETLELERKRAALNISLAEKEAEVTALREEQMSLSRINETLESTNLSLKSQAEDLGEQLTRLAGEKEELEKRLKFAAVYSGIDAIRAARHVSLDNSPVPFIIASINQMDAASRPEALKIVETFLPDSRRFWEKVLIYRILLHSRENPELLEAYLEMGREAARQHVDESWFWNIFDDSFEWETAATQKARCDIVQDALLQSFDRPTTFNEVVLSYLSCLQFRYRFNLPQETWQEVARGMIGHMLDNPSNALAAMRVSNLIKRYNVDVADLLYAVQWSKFDFNPDWPIFNNDYVFGNDSRDAAPSNVRSLSSDVWRAFFERNKHRIDREVFVEVVVEGEDFSLDAAGKPPASPQGLHRMLKPEPARQDPGRDG